MFAALPRTLASMGAAVVLAGCLGGDDDAASASLVVLSNRADLVSGGDALMEVVLPARADAASFTVERDGADISSQFALRSDGRILGVVTGLKEGDNVVTVRPTGGQFRGARLTLTNHPIGGPVLLGSQAQPWVCATPVAVAESGDTPRSNASGLSTAAVDAQCNIAREYKLWYRSTAAGCSTALPDPNPPAAAPANACFKPYQPGTSPADMATTTTSTGRTMPYIVRVERGTMNRGIYDIAVLIDPAQPWSAVAPQQAWNGKLLYNFGGGNGQPRLQTRSSQNWANDMALSRGFMVAAHSLTDSAYNSNQVLNAETLMMMKEHVADHYGEILFTMGNGCSGGSIQQNTAASMYPGLLDGLQLQCDFADSITPTLEIRDCILLTNFYAGAEWGALNAGVAQARNNAKKAAINGHLDHLGCQSWLNAYGAIAEPGNYVPQQVTDAVTGAVARVGAPRNSCMLPAGAVYDPVTNPGGPRCSAADWSAEVYGSTAGLVAGSTRALSIADNTGVQYGLAALRSGAISAEEFVVLNEQIGGIDVDGRRGAQRSQADAAALDIAYRGALVAHGLPLSKVPIIDLRGWDEQGLHFIYRSFSQRDRLDRDAGGHANQVMWRYGTGLQPPAASGLTLQSFLVMDEWLMALATSAPKSSINGERSQAQVAAAKPASAFDFCYLTGDAGFSTQVTDAAVCDADPRLKPASSPRQVAGGPRSEDILKCRLKPLDAADHSPAVLSAAQLARLQAVFPDGVCDWSRPGVGQQPPQPPRSYATGPGGAELPPAPRSKPI